MRLPSRLMVLKALPILLSFFQHAARNDRIVLFYVNSISKLGNTLHSYYAIRSINLDNVIFVVPGSEEVEREKNFRDKGNVRFVLKLGENRL